MNYRPIYIKTGSKSDHQYPYGTLWQSPLPTGWIPNHWMKDVLYWKLYKVEKT